MWVMLNVLSVLLSLSYSLPVLGCTCSLLFIIPELALGIPASAVTVWDSISMRLRREGTCWCCHCDSQGTMGTALQWQFQGTAH